MRPGEVDGAAAEHGALGRRGDLRHGGVDRQRAVDEGEDVVGGRQRSLRGKDVVAANRRIVRSVGGKSRRTAQHALVVADERSHRSWR